MDKIQAIQSIKNLNVEASQLYPSALLNLFEIDISDIAFNRGVISQTDVNSENNTVFRFHNNIKISTNSLIWQGKTYIAAPIQAEGWEMSVKGVLPNPKLSMTVSDEGIPFLSKLKDRINQLAGDLVGAKVTRIRTFAKFLDAVNFYDSLPPIGFLPDPGSEMPRDIFYIDRKSSENKNSIIYDLVSPLDLEQIKLPARLVISNNCPFQYRAEGCLYEYNNRRNVLEHGKVGDSILPNLAPAVATDNDELISDLLPGVSIVDKGEYQSDIVYNVGDQVFIHHGNINYYFVAKVNGITIPPPNINYWINDKCSKLIVGCTLRYGLGGSAKGNVTLGNLPYGAFISVNRFS